MNDKDNLKSLEEISKTFNEAMAEIEKDQEQYWNSLSKEDQLKAFCAVSRRIYQAELVDQGTYRHTLYGVFKFGPESYVPAQMANYLEIHNAIMASDHDSRLLEAFCAKYNIEDADNKIKEFFL